MKNFTKARAVPRNQTFKVEIIANYPKYRQKDKQGNWMIVGSCHVYLEDYDIDLRGIHYIWKKGKFHIRFPSKKGEIDGKPCLYLIFSFCSQEKQKLLTQAIKQALREFATTEEYCKQCDVKACEE